MPPLQTVFSPKKGKGPRVFRHQVKMAYCTIMSYKFGKKMRSYIKQPQVNKNCNPQFILENSPKKIHVLIG